MNIVSFQMTSLYKGQCTFVSTSTGTPVSETKRSTKADKQANVEVLKSIIFKIHLYKPTKLKLDHQFPQ